MNLKERPAVYDELGCLKQLLVELGCKSLFLVADPNAYRLTGADQVIDSLPSSFKVTLFQDFQPNPDFEELQQGITAFNSAQPDVTVAIGGGTALDLAKVIGFCAAQPDKTTREIVVETPAEANPAIPLIAVPTTSGTGSQATRYAAIYVEGTKYSVAHEYLIPNIAILDPAMTMTMPPNITADVGLDAFCQAIESTWSVNSTEESIKYAAEATQLAWQNLLGAVNNPNKENRRAMCHAAHLAGKAINITQTTAPHAISYTLTANQGVPHGQAVALTLGAILVFNSEVTAADCIDPRGPEHIRQQTLQIAKLLGFSTIQEAQEGICNFITSLGCPTRLSEVGIIEERQILEIAKKVNLQRLANNPRQLQENSLIEILKSIQ